MLYFIYPLAVKVSALLAVLTLVLAPFHQIFLDWNKKKKKVRAPMTTNDWSKSLFQLSSNYYAYKNVICLIRPFRSSLRALLIVSNKSETKVRKNSIFVLLFILRFLSVLLARCIQFARIILIQQISLQNHTPSKFVCIVALFVYR